MKYLSLLCLLLFVISCNGTSDKTEIKSETENSFKYSAIHSLDWSMYDYGLDEYTPVGPVPTSYFGKGTCEVVDDKIIYTKVDVAYQGLDYCEPDDTDIGRDPEAGCQASYKIDFSASNPVLQEYITECLP